MLALMPLWFVLVVGIHVQSLSCSQGGKFGMQPPYPGLVMYNDFTQPPPAHMGIPPVHTDPKTGKKKCLSFYNLLLLHFSLLGSLSLTYTIAAL